MKSSRESDVRFQVAIKNILGTMYASHDVENTTADEAKKILVEKLIDLRTYFVITHWVSSQIRKAGETSFLWQEATEDSIKSLKKFTLLRDSKEAQEFLTQNLYFFSRIDRQIYADMKEAVLAYVEDELRVLP